jgi:hypothetical protein
LLCVPCLPLLSAGERSQLNYRLDLTFLGNTLTLTLKVLFVPSDFSSSLKLTFMLGAVVTKVGHRGSVAQLSESVRTVR